MGIVAVQTKDTTTKNEFLTKCYKQAQPVVNKTWNFIKENKDTILGLATLSATLYFGYRYLTPREVTRVEYSFKTECPPVEEPNCPACVIMPNIHSENTTKSIVQEQPQSMAWPVGIFGIIWFASSVFWFRAGVWGTHANLAQIGERSMLALMKELKPFVKNPRL